MSNSSFEHRFQVALSDTDAAGILFYANLFRHAHDAYERFMASLGFPLHGLIREGRFHLPLVHAESDYKRPMYHGESISIRLSIHGVSKKSFSVEYLFALSTGECSARAMTVHVATDRSGRAVELPQDLQGKLMRFREG